MALLESHQLVGFNEGYLEILRPKVWEVFNFEYYLSL